VKHFARSGSPEERIGRFEALRQEGYIDLDSGVWDFITNLRAAHCGRCAVPIRAGDGKPYNELMSDGYRASTRYLCPGCSDVIARRP